jgi:hypothetical protein
MQRVEKVTVVLRKQQLPSQGSGCSVQIPVEPQNTHALLCCATSATDASKPKRILPRAMAHSALHSQCYPEPGRDPRPELT